MPLLAGLMLVIVGKLAAFLGAYVGRKLALGIAATGAFSLATISMYGVLSLLLTGLTAVLPTWPGMQIAIWFAVPPAVPGAIAAAISADVAIGAYKWHTENIKIMSYIT